MVTGQHLAPESTHAHARSCGEQAHSAESARPRHFEMNHVRVYQPNANSPHFKLRINDQQHDGCFFRDHFYFCIHLVRQ